MKTQPISETMTCPKFHHADNAVSRYWWLPGTNSRKIIESTGTLPPAAVPMMAHMTQKAMKLLVPPTANPKIPPMSKVRLNAGLRPMKSAEMLQKEAPHIMPT